MGSKSTVASVLAAGMLVSSCTTQGQGPSRNQTTGAVAGTALGTGLGFLVPFGGGALLSAAGGYVGARVGAYLDEKEKREMADATIRAAAQAKTGERVYWGEPNPGEQPSPGPQPNSAVQADSNAPPGTNAPSSPTDAVSSSEKKEPLKSSPPAGSGIRTANHKSARPSNSDANVASGWVQPLTDDYVTSKGQTCRDVQQVANKGGKKLQQKVQACQSGSDWVIPQA